MQISKLDTRILLSAFACDPAAGSERYVGWNWAIRLHEIYDLTVLTRTFSKNIITNSNTATDLKIVDFDLPGCADKDGKWKFIKIYYIAWQVCAFFIVLYLHSSKKYQAIHHLTYNVVDMPGFLWCIPGAKFFWGPVGGGQVPPRELKRVYGSEWGKERLRALLKLMVKINPVVVGAALRSSHIFFANKETAKLLSHCGTARSIMLETAIDAEPEKSRPRNEVFTALWLGNVINRKALILALDGFKSLLDQGYDDQCKLIVGGDGPQLSPMKAYAEKLGIIEHVDFLGRVPFEQVLNTMDSCDVFLFTSAQDTSGNVVLEAMSRGKPVIALDHQGVSEIITSESAIGVPIGPYDDIAHGIGKALRKLADDDEMRQRLAKGAHANVVENHRWANRISHYQKIVSGILNQSSSSSSPL